MLAGNLFVTSFGDSKLREFTSDVCKSFGEIETIKNIDSDQSHDSGAALSLRLRKMIQVKVFSKNFLLHFLQLRHIVWELNALFHITTELKLSIAHH